MKNKQHTLPSFYLISSAVDGNENAIEKLLLFYEAYISKCCLRPFAHFMMNTVTYTLWLIWN